jgi:hypothetical protein
MIPSVARAVECHCHNCGEGLYFVEGVYGPARWRHVRTETVDCRPVCQQCGQMGTEKVGRATQGGDGFPTFITEYFLCAPCADRRGFIEVV